MKIIIDNNTNEVLRYGNDVAAEGGEYLIERDVDFTSCECSKIYYNPIRRTFRLGEDKRLQQLKDWYDEEHPV